MTEPRKPNAPPSPARKGTASSTARKGTASSTARKGAPVLEATLHARMNRLDWTLLLVLAAVWSGSFVCIEIALREIPPLTMMALRVQLAAFLLFLVLRARKLPLPPRRLALQLTVMGLLNNALPFTLIAWEQIHLQSGLSALLVGCSPIFSVLIAHFATGDEKISVHKIVGVLLGFVGLAVLVGVGLNSLESKPEGASSPLGFLAPFAAVAAGACYASAAVYGKRLRRSGLPFTSLAFGQLFFAALLLTPAALLVDHPWTLPVPSLPAIASIVFMAAFASALAYMLYFRLLATVGAVNLTLVGYLVPAGTVVLGLLFLGEAFSLRHALGALLIALGIAATDGRAFGALRARLKL